MTDTAAVATPTPTPDAPATPAVVAEAPIALSKETPVASQINDLDDDTFAEMFGTKAAPADTRDLEAFKREEPKVEAVEEAAAVEIPEGHTVDATGKVHAPDGKFTGQIVPPPTGDAVSETEPPTDAAPEKRALLAEFSLKAPDASLVEPHALADHEVTYKANGKEITRTLDHVVKMAQMGEYNAEREERIKQTADRLPGLESQLTQQQQYTQQLQATVMKMLADETGEEFLAARDRYLQANSPEARAQRAEQQVQSIQQQRAQEAQAQHAQSFFATLAPRLEALETQHSLVSQEEIVGIYTLLTTPLMRGGVIPVESYPLVEQVVNGELAHRIASLQQKRSDERAQATAAAKAQAEAEKVAAEKAQADKLQQERQKRAVAEQRINRGLAPTGAVPSSARPKPKAPQSVGEFMDNFAEHVRG